MSKSKEEYVENTLNQFLEREAAWEISLSDIIDSDEYKELCPTPDQCGREEFLQLLYIFGMDTEYPIKSQIVKHRNWKDQVVVCERWVGKRRQDSEWIAFIQSANKYQNN